MRHDDYHHEVQSLEGDQVEVAVVSQRVVVVLVLCLHWGAAAGPAVRLPADGYFLLPYILLYPHLFRLDYFLSRKQTMYPRAVRLADLD